MNEIDFNTIVKMYNNIIQWILRKLIEKINYDLKDKLKRHKTELFLNKFTD